MIVRLIQAGKYAAAVKLDRQFSLVIPASSASSHIQAVPTSARSEQIKKGAKNRKDMIDEIMQVMPRAERELLELELQKMVPSAPSVGASSSIGDLSGSGSFGDLSMSMSMSWESIRGPAGSLGNPSPSSSFVTVPNPNGLEGSSSSLKSQNQKQGANTKDSSTHPSNPLLRKPRVADTSFVPIPQRSGAPRFGGPPPIVPITSPGRGVVGSGQTTRPPIAGVAISGVLRAARGIPQFDGAPSPPQGQGQVGERKSLFETVGSANRARNAFFDPQMQTQTISGTVPSEGPTTSAGAKRPFGVLQRDFAGSANASGRGTRMSFGSGLGGVGMEDVSSASANAVLQELLAEDGQDSDIEIEESGVSGVEPQEPREKVQDKGDVEMGSGSERGRSSSPIRPPKSKGKAKAMRSVPGADVENQLDSSTVTKEFSFSVFSPTPPTGAPESPAAPSHPVATSGLGRKSPGGVKAPEKIARSETWMNMPPGAFIPDDVHEKAVSSVHHPLPSPAKSSKARRKEPTTTTSSTMERATRATGRPRRSVKKRETGQKLSFPGSLISDDDDLSHSDRDLEEEEEETNHLPPMQTLRSSPRKRRGTRTSEADMDEQEGEDVVMPLPPATPARRQPARKSRPSTGATPQKSGAATAKKKRESAGVVKEGRTTRRSTRLSSVVLPSTVEERGGSESPEPISPVKGRRAAGSKASGGGTGTGIAASVSAERGSKGRSSGKKGR